MRKKGQLGDFVVDLTKIEDGNEGGDNQGGGCVLRLQFVYSSFIVRSSFDQVRGWLYGSWGVSGE